MERDREEREGESMYKRGPYDLSLNPHSTPFINVSSSVFFHWNSLSWGLWLVYARLPSIFTVFDSCEVSGSVGWKSTLGWSWRASARSGWGPSPRYPSRSPIRLRPPPPLRLRSSPASPRRKRKRPTVWSSWPRAMNTRSQPSCPLRATVTRLPPPPQSSRAEGTSRQLRALGAELGTMFTSARRVTEPSPRSRPWVATELATRSPRTPPTTTSTSAAAAADLPIR